VIGSKEIELQSATNLRDILMTQLNMQVSADPVLGSSISLQGLSGPNVKILMDGIPVLGRENGSIDLSQINLYNIDHIEIIQGPASTVYGADAIGGVINLISKTNVTNPVEVNLNTKYETIGTYNLDAGFNFSKNNSAFNIYGGRNFFDGYSADESERSLLWKPREQYFGGIGFTQKFKASQLRYKAD
jgi:outer membrane receptor for ferrienterochelin and colicins